MKRVFVVLLALLLIFTGCQKEIVELEKEEETTNVEETPVEDNKIRLAGLKGPTTMGMVKLLEDEKDSIDFQMAVTGDEIVPKLIKGELDLAAIPVNLAATVFNKSQNIKLVSTNTMGVLYIVTTDPSIKTLDDLKGKTIMATGQGTVPEWTLKTLLDWREISTDDVKVEWKIEPTEIAGLLAKDGGTAMLPEPFVTVAKGKVPSLEVPMNLTEIWTESFGIEPVTGVLVASKKFIETRKADLDNFLDAYKKSIEYVNENPVEASALIEKYEIVPQKVAEVSIPKCNLKFEEGDSMKDIVSSFLDTLGEQYLQAIGGTVPGEEFYYKR
ncbi:MAG: ABC transporter substrate-binding protein [Tissierellia bacterium]|nr:ABC transporter substrate-binding protein [Tissierellia bacterium]